MAFSTKEKDSTFHGQFPIKVDLNPVYLTKVAWEQPKENWGIALYWEFEGVEKRDMMFDFTKSSIKTFNDESREDAFERAQKEYSSKIRHILSMYVEPEVLESLPECDTLEEICDQMIDLIKGKTKEVPLYLKVLKNADGFPEIPRHAKTDFLQKVITGAPGECKLAYTKREKEMADKVIQSSGVKERRENKADDDIPVTQGHAAGKVKDKSAW